jgi:hypothetical protein
VRAARWSSTPLAARSPVAPNDLLLEVAGGFGITPDDASYLNPAREGSPEYPMLHV